MAPAACCRISANIPAQQADCQFCPPQTGSGRNYLSGISRRQKQKSMFNKKWGNTGRADCPEDSSGRKWYLRFLAPGRCTEISGIDRDFFACPPGKVKKHCQHLTSSTKVKEIKFMPAAQSLQVVEMSWLLDYMHGDYYEKSNTIIRPL